MEIWDYLLNQRENKRGYNACIFASSPFSIFFSVGHPRTTHTKKKRVLLSVCLVPASSVYIASGSNPLLSSRLRGCGPQGTVKERQPFLRTLG